MKNAMTTPEKEMIAYLAVGRQFGAHRPGQPGRFHPPLPPTHSLHIAGQLSLRAAAALPSLDALFHRAAAAAAAAGLSFPACGGSLLLILLLLLVGGQGRVDAAQSGAGSPYAVQLFFGFEFLAQWRGLG